MQIIRSKAMEFIPASHENKTSPGVWKKVILKAEDLTEGRVQMVNWALLPAGKAFSKHYHEDMQEIFIVLSGRAKIVVGAEEARLEAGDTVVIPIGTTHEMKSMGTDPVEYIVVGITQGKHGKTIVVDET